MNFVDVSLEGDIHAHPVPSASNTMNEITRICFNNRSPKKDWSSNYKENVKDNNLVGLVFVVVFDE